MNTSTQQMIEDLAAQMGVSAADVRCLAQSVANSIEQDKAAGAYVAMDEEMQAEFALAYVPHAVRKFEQFRVAYQTRGRSVFSAHVISLCADAA